MAIPSKKLIAQKAKERGLLMINGCSGPRPFQIDILESDNAVEDFFDLVKSLGKTHFFYDAAIYDKETLEGYCIDTDQITDSYYGDVAHAIKNEATKHNKRLLSHTGVFPIKQTVHS